MATVSSQIERIIQNKSLRVQFQSVLSHHTTFPRGMEAFIKGIDPDDGSFVHPFKMFEDAAAAGLLQALNRAMLQKTFEAFSVFYTRHSNLVIFINIHESIVGSGAQGVSMLQEEAAAFDIDPKSVILDIADYSGLDVEVVQAFIMLARASKFYISVDDVGKNYFNMDRILLYNPDMIKINQQYIAALSDQGYREGIKTQISILAHALGIIVGVTGIETADELEIAFEEGAQFFQGYYIDKPALIEDEAIDEYLSAEYKRDKLKTNEISVHVDESRSIMNRIVVLLNELKEESTHWHKEAHEEAFQMVFEKYPFLQTAWVINREGIQVTPGKINNKCFGQRNTSIFKVFDVGHDYSGEEFYQILSKGMLDVWITKPYISLLNNEICVSTASYLDPIGEEGYILCLEISFGSFKSIYMSQEQKPTLK